MMRSCMQCVYHQRMTIPRLHTPAEAAPLVGCTENWLRDKARIKAIPHHRPGGKIMFTDDDVEEIIRTCAVRPVPATPEASAGSGRRPRGDRQPAQVPLLESRPPRGKVA